VPAQSFPNEAAMSSDLDLVVVVPVFNEAPALPLWFREWDQAFSNCGLRPLIIFVDDRSTDESPSILARYSAARGSDCTLVIRNDDQNRKGHGHACMLGYREAINRKSNWILQLDSDGQCDPQVFADVWRARSMKEPVFGCRTNRLDGDLRTLSSKIVRALATAIFQVDVPDPNSPYRLMPTNLLKPILFFVPDGFVLKNIAIATMFAKRHGTIRISTTFRLRTSPGTEKPLWFFVQNGLVLFFDLLSLRLKTMKNDSAVPKAN
jgi:dolichol-phosphate mannosyltransferase